MNFGLSLWTLPRQGPNKQLLPNHTTQPNCLPMVPYHGAQTASLAAYLCWIQTEAETHVRLIALYHEREVI